MLLVAGVDAQFQRIAKRNSSFLSLFSSAHYVAGLTILHFVFFVGAAKGRPIVVLGKSVLNLLFRKLLTGHKLLSFDVYNRIRLWTSHA